MRFFNTAGPAVCEDHYCIDPLKRFNLDEILSLIDQKKYFVLHAPRQTGKTTCLLALMDYLNKEGKYKCLHINVEGAQGEREDVKNGVRTILTELANNAEMFLNDQRVKDIWLNLPEKYGENYAFNTVVAQWAVASDQPIVLLIDEIDALVGDTLISVLRQIRAGYTNRPAMFPQSIILCGVRDVRDYRIHSLRQKEIITGGSAFNIKAKSLRLGDFSKQEMDALYQCHTHETGQEFHGEALDLAWNLTEGQPWLVNALAYEACFKMTESRDRSIPITAETMARAKENIILRRETHIDQLVDKLQEKRVQRVVEPVLAGGQMPEHISIDDIGYVEDLGLIKKNGNIRIANGIYKEVIPRELTYSTQVTITHDSTWYVKKDGSLDMEKLFLAFQGFFREHSESWTQGFQYHEAGPQLLLQAFLQRIVNSGGRVEREYGLGRMRTDLLLIWNGKNRVQKVVIELKIRYNSLEETIEKGLEQTWAYMDKCAADSGHLVIFDRSEKRSWDEKIFVRKESFKNTEINVWGM